MRPQALRTMLDIELQHFDDLAEKKDRVCLRLDASAKEIERLKTEMAVHSITPETKAVNFRGIE